MEILVGRIDWAEQWDNGPSIYLLVDKMPDYSDLRYTKVPVFDKVFGRKRSGYIYYAELDGYVSFYYYSSPGKGYGGRKFPLSMVDGTIEILIGPWSSNSPSVNNLGLGPCTEVAITDEEKVWRRGHTFYGAAVTTSLLRKYIGRITFGEQFARRRYGSNEIVGPITIFPCGSMLEILPVKWSSRTNYIPMVRFPDGTLWTKLEKDLNNIIETGGDVDGGA